MKWMREQVDKGLGAVRRRWRRLRAWRPPGWHLVTRLWGWACERAREHRRGLGVLVVVLIAVIAWAVVDARWEWLRGIEEGKESHSTTIRNVGLIVGGAIALLIAVWRSRVAERQADTAQEDLRNKRYQESAAMLGNAVLAVRLAGIYALERLAKEHPEQYHIEVMKSLCAFVRNPTEDKILTRRFEERIKTEALIRRGHPKPELREDVQAALDAIGACHERQATLEAAEKFWLDLHGADLKGANLTGRKLASAPWLDGKMGSLADVFSYRPGPDFSGANLHSAQLDWADLSRANFSGAELNDVYFLSTVLTGAEFSQPPARHLTQFQLDIAYTDPKNPPKLEGLVDPGTRKPLKPPPRDPDGKLHPKPDEESDA